MSQGDFPPGWDEHRVDRVRDHYEQQTDEDAFEEDEESFDRPSHAVVEVPHELLASVRDLIARRRAG